MLHSSQAFQRLATGSFTLARYASFARDPGLQPAIEGALPSEGWGRLQKFGTGFAAAVSPGRWLWFARSHAEVPNASLGHVATDCTPSVACFEIDAKTVGPMLQGHAPSAMDCDLLAHGYKRIAFASWTIELVVVAGQPPIALVPSGHAHNFERLVQEKHRSLPNPILEDST